MKKLISTIMVCAVCLSFTACATETKSPEDGFSRLELVRSEMTDRIPMNDLEMLENFSHIAVVGKFVGDTVQDIEYEYNSFFEKDIITNVMSENTIKVSRVLMGNVNVGDELQIVQRYAVVDDELITFSELTPMQNGDEWIFFLRSVSDTDKYICSADCQSRFPTGESANRMMSLAERADLGVYEEVCFDWDIYNEIVEKYNV